MCSCGRLTTLVSVANATRNGSLLKTQQRNLQHSVTLTQKHRELCFKVDSDDHFEFFLQLTFTRNLKEWGGQSY